MTADERRAALAPLMTAVEDYLLSSGSDDACRPVEQAAVAFAIALYEGVPCLFGMIDEWAECDEDDDQSEWCYRCKELQGWRSIAEEMR